MAPRLLARLEGIALAKPLCHWPTHATGANLDGGVCAKAAHAAIEAVEHSLPPPPKRVKVQTKTTGSDWSLVFGGQASLPRYLPRMLPLKDVASQGSKSHFVTMIQK
jgi:hypothetical protein